MPKFFQSTFTYSPKAQAQTEHINQKPKPGCVTEETYQPHAPKKHRFKTLPDFVGQPCILGSFSLIWILSRTPATILSRDVASDSCRGQKATLKKANFEIGEEKTEAWEKGRRADYPYRSWRWNWSNKEGTKINLVVSSGKQSFQKSNYVPEIFWCYRGIKREKSSTDN